MVPTIWDDLGRSESRQSTDDVVFQSAARKTCSDGTRMSSEHGDAERFFCRGRQRQDPKIELLDAPTFFELLRIDLKNRR